MLSSLCLLSLAYVSAQAASGASMYAQNAVAAANTLQQWYDSSTGLWNTTGWWNSANCLTTLADLAAVETSFQKMTDYVIPTTFAKAPNTFAHFRDGYYDDEGWWALAWIRSYDITGEQQYLDQAESLFEDMKGGWTTPCGGGIWWDKAHTYVNAIANELFLTVAASLANRVHPSNQSYYLAWAQKQWTWFSASGIISPTTHLINDGLTTTAPSCANNNGTIWSYNQGVVLAGLVELSRVTNNPNAFDYIATAHAIACAAISALSVNGILRESCEPDCGADASQFKGIFMRNLRVLQAVSPCDEYARFIEANAISIWNRDRSGNDELDISWAGPVYGTANASTQSSALDALVAAVWV